MRKVADNIDMRYFVNLVEGVVEDRMPLQQEASVSPDPETEAIIRSMEERGVKYLMEQGKSRDEAVRLTREAMDAPLSRKVPSFDEL
jgi:hypothetical protein